MSIEANQVHNPTKERIGYDSTPDMFSRRLPDRKMRVTKEWAHNANMTSGYSPNPKIMKRHRSCSVFKKRGMKLG